MPSRSTRSLERTLLARRGAPTSVRAAIVLFCVSIAIGLAQLPVDLSRSPSRLDTFVIAPTIGFAACVFLAAFRRNWARYLLVLWFVGGLVVDDLYPENLDDSALAIGTFLVRIACEAVALYWLFTGDGERWYESRA